MATELQREVCNQAIEKGLVKPYDIIDYTYSNSRLKEIQQGEIKLKNASDNNVSCTLTTNLDNFGIAVPENKDTSSLRIRTYTPLESWRLMGFDDEDFDKARNALNNTFYKGKDKSSSQLYKQAGNSIVVQVLMAIKRMMIADIERSKYEN